VGLLSCTFKFINYTQLRDHDYLLTQLNSLCVENIRRKYKGECGLGVLQIIMTEPFSESFNHKVLQQLLDSIQYVNPVQAGDQLYKTLKQANANPGHERDRLVLLQQLTPLILRVIDDIIDISTSQSGAKKRKTQRLCLQLCRHLCLGFHRLHNQEALTADEQRLAIFFALQMAGQDMFLRHRLHSPLSDTLGTISAELYKYALNQHYLTDSVSTKIPVFLSQKTIDAVIKRNILFALCTVQYHSKQECRVVFNFANQFGDLLTLPSYPSSAINFYWNILEGVPAQIKKPDQTFSSQDIFIDTQALKETIENSDIKLNLADAKQKRLFQYLTGYQKLIIDSRPSAPIIFNMVAGFEPCFQYLKNRQKILRIQQLSHGAEQISAATVDNNVLNLGLEPLEFEEGLIEQTEIFSIKNSRIHNSENNLTAVKFQPTTDPNFFLIEAKSLSLNNGEFVILANKRNAIRLGISRQQKTIPHIGMQRVLVEMIQSKDNNCYTYHNPKNEDVINIILLNEHTDEPEILIKNSKMKPGDQIKIADKTIILLTLIEYTAHLMRYKISILESGY